MHTTSPEKHAQWQTPAQCFPSCWCSQTMAFVHAWLKYLISAGLIGKEASVNACALQDDMPPQEGECSPVASTSSLPLKLEERWMRWMSAGGTPLPRRERLLRHALSPVRSTSPPSLKGPSSCPAPNQAMCHVSQPPITSVRGAEVSNDHCSCNIPESTHACVACALTQASHRKLTAFVWCHRSRKQAFCRVPSWPLFYIHVLASAPLGRPTNEDRHQSRSI